MDCRWCRVQMRERKVLVGAPPGRPVRLFIDVVPHDDGVVLERDDGRFRLLTEGRAARAAGDGRLLYRVHGRRSCAPARQKVER